MNFFAECGAAFQQGVRRKQVCFIKDFRTAPVLYLYLCSYIFGRSWAKKAKLHPLKEEVFSSQVKEWWKYDVLQK